ncbi:MAG: hypothetical protein AB8G15_07250 [Saprospiraceae bacterium]
MEFSNSISKGGAEWVDDKYLVWPHLDGIHLTDIETKHTQIIRNTCNAQHYQLPTYSPQLDKVVFQRIDRVQTNGKKGVAYNGLYMMNLDGSCEEKIEILE